MNTVSCAKAGNCATGGAYRHRQFHSRADVPDEQHRERPQSLAAVVNDVVRDLVDERDVAPQAADDRAVHVGPILTDGGPKSVKRRDWRQGVGEGHSR